MISVAEAKKIIQENTTHLKPVKVLLGDAAGLILAENIYATIDIPTFRQSSMDGYAIVFDGGQLNKTRQISGEMAAGTNAVISITNNQAARIFTGAPLPNHADTVVMQEKITIENGQLSITDQQLQLGNNVRAIGSEIKAGALALGKNSPLTAPAIGFLAGIGVAEVPVYPMPTVSIIVTGNELQKPGNPLQFGQVYESNSFALQAALKQMDINKATIYNAADTLQDVIDILQKALQKSDVVLLTGGVSVGDYDFVLQAASECGIEKLFHKVKQKPGKPLYVGKKDNKLIFGLPGNPSSVLSCFYQYAYPALKQFGNQQNDLQTIQVPLLKALKKTAGITHFLKGFYDGKVVTELNAQESYKLNSFANANCMIQLNEETTECKEGELVNIYLLPF